MARKNTIWTIRNLFCQNVIQNRARAVSAFFRRRGNHRPSVIDAIVNRVEVENGGKVGVIFNVIRITDLEKRKNDRRFLDFSDLWEPRFV